MRYRAFVVAACFGTLVSTAVAEVIDFESVPGATSNPTYTLLDVGAYRFTATHMHAIGNFSIGVAQNGTAVVLANEGSSQYGSAITVTRIDGQPFSLMRFDAAECWTPPLSGYPNATAIQVDAVFAAGGQTSLTIPLDGILDGPGPLQDFETLVPVGLTDVLSVSLAGVGPGGASNFAYMLDDIVVDQQPCVAAYGNGCPGAGGFTPVLDAPVCAAASMAFVITLQQAPGGAQALLFFGTQEGATPIGASGCSLLVQPATPLLVAIPLGGAGPGAGFASLGGNIPAGLSGLQFTMQAVVSDPTSILGFVTTNGLHVLVQ